MKILYVTFGLLLLLPTAYFCFLYLKTGSDGRPIALGLWMFFGLPTMLGAIFAFREAGNV